MDNETTKDKVMKKKTKTPSQAKVMQRLFAADSAEFFAAVRAGVEKLPEGTGPYAGFRAWSDGYRAGLLAAKRKS